ncbi:hypothetical protein BDV93DRAFT_602682 [Ceratobasidium sp. AG-I]|nr:hypothetical protein BDV93DRAFT_602682 [Ceratobasidium sp. AG-I]
MYPHSHDPSEAHETSTYHLVSSHRGCPKTTADTSVAAFEVNRDSSSSQDIAPLSPSIDVSDDSVPALNLFGSPSPTDDVDASLLSDTSFGGLGPLTPVKRLFEEVLVNNIPNSPRYQRIHSTPYPKPRLPLQLTPHPQSRMVSLPEWSRNRNPFLEAVRNLRSVSSPARLKPAPTSPIYAKLETSNSASEVSGDSSGSSVLPLSFAALSDPEQPALSSRLTPNQTNASYTSREQFYVPPEGLFFTPPSSQSLILTPPTTAPDRSLPKDRPTLTLQKADLSRLREGYSEAEVSSILQQMSLESSSRLNRSSVGSIPSRSSSPESVVFLSPMARLPRAFLGNATKARPTFDFSTFSSAQATLGPVTHVAVDNAQEDTSTQYLVTPQKHSPMGNKPREDMRDSHSETASFKQSSTVPQVTSSSGSEVAHDPDWILFDPPKPIPALHGPASLPYARCPSGAEGVILDDQQEAGGVVWGLSGVEANPPTAGVSRAPIQVATRGLHGFGAERRDTNRTCPLDLSTEDVKKLNANASAFSPAQARSMFNKQQVASMHPSILPYSQHIPTQSTTKGKHVRFVDGTSDGSATQRPATNVPAPVVGPWPPIYKDTPTFSNATNAATESLAEILLDQLKRARETQLRELQRSWAPPSRQETLDQLRQFGVPFRSHGLPTPPSTTSPLFTSKFPATSAFTRPMDLPPQDSRQQFSLGMGSQPGFLSASHRSTALSDPTAASTQLLEIRPVNTGPGSLSNAKSIPLLKLRQRQHAEFLLHTKGLPKEDTTGFPSHAKSSARNSPQTDVQERRSSSNTSHTAPVPEETTDGLPLASASTNQTGSSMKVNTPSPNRRRPRKSNKRTQVDISATRSGSPQKENLQASNGQGDLGFRKASSRRTGRKKNSQKNRTDSLPQGASRG